MPNPRAADQVSVSFNAGGGVHIGSVVHLAFYAPGQSATLFRSFGPNPTPTGPQITVHVVGVEASVADFQAGDSSPTLYVTPALLREVGPRAAVPYADEVRLRHGEADVAAFQAAVARLPGGADLYVSNIGAQDVVVERSIHLQAVAWWILAAIAGAAGLAVIAQILVRQAAVDAAEYPLLRAIGMRSSDLLLLGLLRMALVAGMGAIGAVAVAYALSPLTPIGEAGIAEPSPGPSFDGVVLLLGALAVLVVAGGIGAVPSFFQSRRGLASETEDRRPGASRPSFVGAWLGRVGASVSAVVGTRLAFERGRGRTAVPTVTAFLGAILGIVALVGTSVFGASLGHLLSTPRLYGGTYDLQIENPDGDIMSIVPALKRDPGVEQLSGGTETTIRVRGVSVDTLAEERFQGPLLAPPTIVGHPADAPHQIVLGDSTLRKVQAQVGDQVPVTIGRSTTNYTVVGTAVFPVFGDAGGLGTGAEITFQDYEAAACPGRSTAAGCLADGIVINVKPGPGRAATLTRLESAFGNGAELPIRPTTLVNFGQVANLPLLLGIAVGLFGAATLLHFLLVSVSRRRREVGMLKTLGFLRRQIVTVVLWQATTVMVVAIAVGIPLGIVVGRLSWNLAASDFGVVSDIVIPGWEIAAVFAGSLVVANLLAIFPATASSRRSAAPLLQAD